MIESVQSRQETSSEVFRTVVSPEIIDIFLKAAAETGTEIVFGEISDQRSEFIDGKPEPEAETSQKEVMAEINWETKQQKQDFWVSFDSEWRKANC